MKQITFKVATAKGPEEMKGYRKTFYIDGNKIDIVVHKEYQYKSSWDVTEYKTGMSILGYKSVSGDPVVKTRHGALDLALEIINEKFEMFLQGCSYFPMINEN